jgi:hypothetical protein
MRTEPISCFVLRVGATANENGTAAPSPARLADRLNSRCWRALLNCLGSVRKSQSVAGVVALDRQRIEAGNWAFSRRVGG